MSETEHMWQEQEQLRELRMEQLRKDIQAEVESGPVSSLDFDDIKQRTAEEQETRPLTNLSNCLTSLALPNLLPFKVLNGPNLKPTRIFRFFKNALLNTENNNRTLFKKRISLLWPFQEHSIAAVGNHAEFV